MPITRLDRSIFKLSGDGVSAWLEGIITNSLKTELSFAALLTPQGKIIADFFVTKDGDDLIIDTPKKFGQLLFKRLRMYKLRAPIKITDLSEELSVYALWGGVGDEGHVDPRHDKLGRRFISADSIEGDGDYNAHRLSLSVVESEWDFDTQDVFPADANMDLMNGVDFQKGCFVGQEVVSRMKRMTTVKKRMRGVVFSGPAEANDKVLAAERVIGEILSVHDNRGMALIRLNRLEESAGEINVAGQTVEIMEEING